MSAKLAILLHAHMPYVLGHGVWPVGEEWLFQAARDSYVPLTGVMEEHPGAVTLSVTPVLAEQLADAGARQRMDAFADIPAERLDAFVAAATWTSAATHAILPLLATREGIRRQVGEGGAGFWLPECAWAPWIEVPLLAAGVTHVCVEGPRDPLVTPGGLTLIGIDRELMDHVWRDGAYPAAAAYRDSHRFGSGGERCWANDGSDYARDRAREQAALHAVEFADVFARRDRDGLFAVDAELFGLHWAEGVWWLRALLTECERRGIELVTPEQLARSPASGPVPGPSSWGAGRDLSTWSGPRVADLAFAARAAELRVLREDANPARLRELALLQSSDWAFMVSQDTTARYGRERFAAHLRGLELSGDPAGRRLTQATRRYRSQ